MKLAPIISELRRRCPSFERRVYGSAEWAQVDATTAMAMPAAYVVPQGESVEEASMSTGYSQNATQNLGIILCVSTGKDDSGRDAYDRAVDLKHEIIRAICGWAPSDDADELFYDGETVLDLNRARLALMLDFSLPYRITDSETRNGADIDSLPDFERLHLDVDTAIPDGDIEAKADFNL